MHFEARHRFNGTVAQVEAALFDERYLDFLLKHHGVVLEAQQLEKTVDGPLIRRKVRYRPKPVIEAIGPRKVPPEYFAFIEESTYDTRTHELRFKNTPTSKTIDSMMINTGVLRLRDVPGGGCERTFDGDVSLKLPFILKALAMIGETIIKREGLKILDAEAVVMNRFLAEVVKA